LWEPASNSGREKTQSRTTIPLIRKKRQGLGQYLRRVQRKTPLETRTGSNHHPTSGLRPSVKGSKRKSGGKKIISVKGKSQYGEKERRQRHQNTLGTYASNVPTSNSGQKSSNPGVSSGCLSIPGQKSEEGSGGPPSEGSN